LNSSNIFDRPSEFHIPTEELNLDINSITKGMGYQEIPNPQFYQTLEEIFPIALSCIEAVCGFIIFEPQSVQMQNENITINNKVLEIKKLINNYLKMSETLALFLTTAGKKLENLSKTYQENGDLLEAYIIDFIGSETAERSADWLEFKLLESLTPYNLKITNRFSPGYCGWNVNQQQQLFSLLPDNFCGVTLTASSLMIPIKSVSGIIGIGKNVKKQEYSCSICDVENCIRRKPNINK
jgi:hypothetical protein